MSAAAKFDTSSGPFLVGRVLQDINNIHADAYDPDGVRVDFAKHRTESVNRFGNSEWEILSVNG